MHTTTSRYVRRRSTGTLALALAAGLGLSACSLGSSDDSSSDSSGTADSATSEVVVVSHDSFTVPEELLAQFTEETGYEATILGSGDGGEMTNQIILTKGSPLGDAVFGIDNTFASRAVDEGVLAAYASPGLPDSAADDQLSGEGADLLTPIDFGDVCVNIDDVWFEEEGIEPPSSLEDLTDPMYEGLFVTPGANTSSPGLAFMLATVGHFGEDGWLDYWNDLMANDARVTSGWSDAYSVDFTAGGGDGDRPIVVSYSSSPPFTIPEGESEPTTSALLDTCFRQVEYAGVLEGANNPEGAQAFIDFLLSEPMQAALPETMYVYPVDDAVELPQAWAEFADVAPEPITVDAAQIDANRETWVREWADIATQ